MNEKLLQKYATFAVKTAAGLKKDQTLVVRCPVEAAFFARLVAQEAYAVGAREVVVHYNDEKLSRMKMEHCDVEVLEDVKPYAVRTMLDYVDDGEGAVYLSIISRNPELYKGIDTDKVDRSTVALNKAMKEFRELTMSDRVQWTIVAVPGEAWNSKVFPDLPPQEATEKMWEAIFRCTRVEGGDPEGEWEQYIENTLKRREKLNSYRFESVRLQASNGTDLTVGLAQGHTWDGGLSVTPDGKRFIANVPTEEVFTAPHREKVNGRVYGSKPYIYNGDIIEDFYFDFKDGAVVDYDAKVGKELLAKLLDSDENSRRLGEIALVDNNSGVGKSGLLYFNTLYDENAACHIAFGCAYPTNVDGGESMTKEQLEKHGVNTSIIHEDVMVGTADINVTGITADGKEITLLKDGYWVI